MRSSSITATAGNLRVLCLAAGLAMLLAFNGCDYLRLLRFKSQLKQIDRYFKLTVHDGITLTCVEPVLNQDDILVLMADLPTRNFSENQRAQWQYRFHKRYVRGQTEIPNFDFSQILTFEQGLLSEIRYTAAFLSVFAPEILQDLLQAIGRGTLDQNEERLVFHGKTRQLSLPTRPQIETAWGAPYSRLSSESGEHYLYIYTLDVPHLAEEEPVPILQIWLTFQADTSQLVKLTAWYKHVSLEVSCAEKLSGYLNIDL